jgi:UPF0271 protein
MTLLRSDLNIDLGELPNEPDELYALAHRVNVACGGHAGDEATMRDACLRAQAAGALIGAHPSYEDRAGFGRRALQIEPEILRRSIEKQCAALRLAAEAVGARVGHMKPHGALYHEANAHAAVAKLTVEAALHALGPVAIIGPPEGELRQAAGAAGLAFLAEGFADRRYLATGALAPRSQPDALITEPGEAWKQAIWLAASNRFQTICVHADTPNGVAIAAAVRRALDER